MIKKLAFLAVCVILAFLLGYFFGIRNVPLDKVSYDELKNQLREVKEENNLLNSQISDLRKEIESIKSENITNQTQSQNNNQIGCGKGCAIDSHCDDYDPCTIDKCVVGTGFCTGTNVCSNTQIQCSSDQQCVNGQCVG
ncbi:hypothetical protein HYV50_01580 [Candidatus Pacearchaeota archaeon]|nr:hypothetical protein [Candidatus Pacearchaeota archaeon]